MRITDYGAFSDFWVRDEGAFYLGGAHAVTGDVDDVIDTTCDPIVAIFVAATAVAGKVIVLVVGEVSLFEAFMIAPDSTHLCGPAVFDAEHAFRHSVVDFLARLRL